MKLPIYTRKVPFSTIPVAKRPSRPRLNPSTLFLAAGAILLAYPVFASDGVLEINATCAVQTGCVPGDTPGYPVTLDGAEQRNYRLTSDLILPNANTSGIQLLSGTSGISIDLSGFTIRGVTSCSGSGGTIACAPIGSGIGIRQTGVSYRANVYNGHIEGTGSTGISLGSNAIVHDVSVAESGGTGISVGAGSTIRDSTSYRNLGAGMFIGLNAVARNCTSTLNGGNGFTVTAATVVSGSIARGNGGSGIQGGGGTSINIQGSTIVGNDEHGIDVNSLSTIRNNSVTFNDLTGITAGEGAVIEGNAIGQSGTVGISASDAATIRGNSVTNSDEDGIIAGIGSTIQANTVLGNGSFSSHDGIQCSLGCRVDNNSVRGNSGFGLRFNSNSSGYSSNAIGANTGGTVTFGRDTGSNVCETSTTCP